MERMIFCQINRRFVTQMNRWILTLNLLALTGLGNPGLICAEDWSRFRGPNGSGIIEAKNLPVLLDDTTKVWQKSIGAGWSSPVLWDGKLYLAEESKESARRLLCLHAETGEEIWSYELPYQGHKKHHFNSFASSTPFVNEQGIFVNWTNGEAIEALALDHEGKLKWRNEKLSPYIHEHGSGTSAVVVDGVMIVRCEFEGPDNFIFGLDAETGAIRWKLPIESTKNTYSTPVVRETSNGKEVILCNSSNGFMGIDVKSGKLNWQHNPGFKQRSVGSFAFDGKRLFGTLGSGGGGKESAVLDFSKGDKPEESYQLTAGIPYVPTPLVLDGVMHMLGDGGIFKTVDFATGEVIYQERLVGAAGNSTKFFSSPVSGDGKIYCCSQTGDVLVLKPGKEFLVLGVSKLDGPMYATPAISDGRIYVRTDKSLYVFGGKENRVP